MNVLPCNLQIDEDVSYRPMNHQLMDLGLEDKWRDGRIVAVRFTKYKVFYDILDDYYAILFNTVDSTRVRPVGDYPDPEEEEEEGYEDE